MKRNLIFTVFVCLLLSVMSSAHAVSVSIHPELINTVDTGSSFKVDVWVKDVTDLGAFQFDLTFDSDISYADAGSVVFGDFIESTGRRISIKMADDDTPGRLTCTVMTEPPVPGTSVRGPDGSGILATITFQRQSLNDDFLNLDNIHIMDTKDKTIFPSPIWSEIKPRHHITASVKSGSGSISPSGDVLVKPGESQTFTVLPSGCWYTADVKVDGVSKSPPYTISNVNENHTIDAYFGLYQFTINVCIATGGSISPGGNVTVNCGSSPKFVITPDKGYRIKNVIVDGGSKDRISEYTFPPISSGHNICAEFYPVPMGDIDGNDAVDLTDAILALRILCGTDIGDQKIFIDADVNGDGKIGIEEVVYILQKVAELR